MTPHNRANIGEIAKTFLLPGDPLRAKFCAENFMDNPKLVTDIRNVLGYTGTYKGIPVSVMASGMGAPSAGIYSYELFTHYDVDNILRIGTCGGLQKDIVPGTLILSMACSTDSNWTNQYGINGTLAPCADYGLLSAAVDNLKKTNISYRCGMTFSSDLFSTYNAAGLGVYEKLTSLGCLCSDMETIAVYCNAMYTHKKALAILTMTDNCITGEHVEDSKRMECTANMIKIALETAVSITK